MSLCFFGDNFYKMKETFKIFSQQMLEVYRILLVETNLKSIMFYQTFSVINTLFVPCTALLYDSTVTTQTLKLSATLLSISFGIRLITFSDDVLPCLPIVFANSIFQVPPQKIVRWVEILGIGWAGVIGLTRNKSVAWEDMADVFTCSVREVMGHLISQTEHLNIAGITSSGTD